MPRSKLPVYAMIITYISFGLIVAIGYMKDIANKIMFWRQENDEDDNMVPIFSKFESFYSRRIYKRLSDCLQIPITGVPGRIINVIERTKTQFPKRQPLLNFGSYNYLGFATNTGNVTEEVLKSIDNYPINVSSPARDVGVLKVVGDLEREMAQFLHKEDAIVFSMGYGTNTSNIPVLLSEGTLVFSDELNHASIITGIKLGKATVKIFKHNNMKDLEKRLRIAISQGQPKTHRSWKRVVVFVEGIYSMEGSILKLKELVELKKIYKFYIFIDEAHSIGCLGKTGRGVCEYHGVDPKDVDILMGTFTKSFGGMGGYIAGSKKLIDYLRFYSDFSVYGEQMSPIVATQVLESLRCIRDTKEGRVKLKILRRNTKLMREGLSSLGFIILGNEHSPVVPVLVSSFGKLGEFSRICREEGIAIVIVGYPATPLLFCRLRICMSSSHKKEDIVKALTIFSRCGDLLGLKFV
ncbi:Serine palmitoyltransferase 2 [Nosema granulosis]|uniref:serine C-palmitoyltransferase n=1 Tax=Nosema granulosis TaxID=83296 RepID=A0A9P6GXM6_9MICR|nr:Serine palmitoyltransferase 2 [Nosema granulosis]